jgi:hypothetical protein
LKVAGETEAAFVNVLLLDKSLSRRTPAMAWRTQSKNKKEPANWLFFITKMAEPTGFEPATSDVTGRRSNQLNYDSAQKGKGKSKKAKVKKLFGLLLPFYFLLLRPSSRQR